MKQSMGQTFTKIKQFAGYESEVNDNPYFSVPTTMEGITELFEEDEHWHEDKPAQFAALNNFDKVIKQRFDERTSLNKKICKTAPYKELLKQSKSLSGRFSSLGQNRLRWCRIPKVGSTYLKGLEKRVLRSLTGSSVKKSDAKTMIMVREPYSRLLSGYMGKIVTNPPWQRSFGAKITRKFRPTATDNAKRCGHDVTFPEFLKYFIEAETTGWMKNLHFIPMYKQCNPCTSNFDYIGHLETLKDDLSYALRSVNISVNMDFSDEESTSKGKSRDIIKHRIRVRKCESMCSALGKVWWTFHARGLISTEIPFPLKEEQCNTINGTEFADLVWDAHTQSAGRINKPKQRRDALVTLYLQAPLEDRLKVQELMRKDFEIYGYDPQPDDIFPELVKH